MRITIITATLISGILAAPVQAAESTSRPEAIGVGMGATVGAIAGGPVGFIVGAAIGAKIGDGFHQMDVEAGTLADGLRFSTERVATLEHTVRTLQASLDSRTGELERLQASAAPDMQDLLQAGIAIDLLFRTDEDVLTDDTRIRVGELAATLAAMPEIRLQLDGFADERGDAIYNQALSERRARFVHDLLVDHGITDDRITVLAHGESAAADDSTDSYALERKVSVTLFLDDTRHLAANPE
ncbi:MAG TPA: OmpA family protein [Woeseiaceae bacterium]|nr:OmpA family protein [Woeseiaceae bacterium]